MLTPAEYNALPDSRKRDFAVAVESLDRMCAEAVCLARQAQTALFGGESGRAKADRYEIAAMMKRNEVFARHTEYALQGLSIQIATDDRGTPVRVRKPVGFVSLETLAARATAAMEIPSPLPATAAKRTRRAK